jgi:hypothetical protein
MTWCLVKYRDNFTFTFICNKLTKTANAVYGTANSAFGKYVDSIVELGYGLDDRGSTVRFPVGAGNYSLHHRVQNGSGAHPASYPMGTRCSFSGVKAAGEWSWPLTSIWCRSHRMSGAMHSLTSALDGGDWSASRPGRFTPRKEPLVPIG